MPTVSVCVTTYNRAHRLGRTLAPLLAQDLHELIVVDDGSTDHTAAVLRSITDPRFRGRSIRNVGPQVARQVALGHATGDVVLFIDDDVVAGPGLVEGHARYQYEPGWVVVGYMPTAVPRHRSLPSRLYARDYERRIAQYQAQPSTILGRLWMGNVSLWRKDALRVGMMVPGMDRVRHEDRAFGLRCKAAGLQAMFAPSLRATHFHERTLAGFLREASSAGRGEAILHRIFSELGPLDTGRYARGLPLGVGAVVRAARFRPVHRAVSLAGRPLTHLAGWVGATPIEERLAQVLRRLELQRGALSA